MSSADALSDRQSGADAPDRKPSGAGVRREFDGTSDSPSLDRDQRIRAEMSAELIRESGRLRIIPFMVVGILVTVFLERAAIWPAAILAVGVPVMMFAAGRLRRAFEAEPAKTGTATALVSPASAAASMRRK